MYICIYTYIFAASATVQTQKSQMLHLPCICYAFAIHLQGESTNLICRHANAKTTEDGTAWAAPVLPVTLGRRLMIHHLHVLAMHLPRICHAFAMQISALQRSMPGGMAICRRACQAERRPAEEHAGLNVALQKSMSGGMWLCRRACRAACCSSKEQLWEIM